MVRLLSRVDALMHSQGGPLDEHLAAVGEFADVRPDARVDPLYSKQRRQPTASTRTRGLPLPCRARSLLRAKPLPQVLHG